MQYISNCDINRSNLDISRHDIKKGTYMEERIRRTYVPMTETAFYILWCLQQPDHGYSISQKTAELTGGQVVISPGTMYGSLSKMEKDGLIHFVRQDGKRKIYENTQLGREVLGLEIQRIERLYRNSKGEPYA